MIRLGLRTARPLGAGATISRGAAIWVSPETAPVRAFTSVQETGCGTEFSFPSIVIITESVRCCIERMGSQFHFFHVRGKGVTR